MNNKEIMVLFIITIILSFIGGIAIGNTARRNFLELDAKDTMVACEKDKLQDCHVEWVYDGMILMGFEVIGKDVQSTEMEK